jgi:hypothetical protein
MSWLVRSRRATDQSVASCSSEKSVGTMSIKNASSISFEDIEKSISNWKIPKVNIKEIYHVGTFSLLSNYYIKTIEKTIPISSLHETLHLLSEREINSIRAKHQYHYLHFGLIQVAIRSLTRKGLNVSVLACLRDCRNKRFKDSLLGMVEASLSNGPVYFNTFPDFSVSLSDTNIHKVLTLNLQTSGYDLEPGSENISVTYRVYYKAMTTLAPCAKHYTPKGLTTLLQTNPNNRHTIPKTLKWDEITLPEKWVLSQAVEPKSMDQSEVESLIETPDGDVEITFASKQKAFLQSRPSVSLDSRPRTKPQNVVYATYEDNSDEPSISDFDINVIELDVGFVIAIEEDEFEIDKDLLKRELRLQKNRPKMKRYFERVDEPFRLKIRELWHKEMREQRKNIFFFDWYESSQVRHFEEFFKRKNMIKKEQKSEAEDLTVIKKVSTEWETASGNKVDSVHPPFESIQLSHNGGKACPLKSISKNTYGETAKVEHIGHLVEQQNYANISLRSLGQQTNRIETILMEGYKTGRPEVKINIPSNSQSSSSQSVSPMFVPTIDPNIKLGKQKAFGPAITEELVNELALKLNNLKVNKNIN